MQELRIAGADAGQRLDRYLRRLLPAVPLSAIFRHLRSGNIRVDGNKAAPALRLAADMVLTLRLPEADLQREPAVAAPSAGSAGQLRGPVPRIVHRDEHVLVVDKPAGMAVMPGSGQGEAHLVAWLARETARLQTRTFAPAPAHRIDRGTSGLCAIGLSPAGLRGLAAAFREGRVQKVYLAVVHGVPAPACGTVDLPLRRVPAAAADAAKMVVARDGQPARTDYEVTAQRGDRAWLRLCLHTGRTHQIRAHLAHLGHPIVGDRRYGSPVRMGRTLLLHAHELVLPHPVLGTELRLVTAPPPAFEA